MKASPKIVEYAKNLYLAINDDGKKIYSNQKISELIAKNYRVKVVESTIRFWAKDNNWALLLQQAKNIGTIKALELNDPDNEDNIREGLANDIAARRKRNAVIMELADDLIMDTLKKQKKQIEDGGDCEIDPRLLDYISKNRQEAINTLDGIEDSSGDKLDEFIKAIRDI